MRALPSSSIAVGELEVIQLEGDVIGLRRGGVRENRGQALAHPSPLTSMGCSVSAAGMRLLRRFVAQEVPITVMLCSLSRGTMEGFVP